MRVSQFDWFSPTNDPVFAITHYNAPDWLVLNLKQIARLHPESTVLIFDNYSTSQKELEAWNRAYDANPKTIFFSNHRDYSNRWMCHVLPLQWLINDAAHKRIDKLVILDQDCIITRRVDDLAETLDNGILIVGARDSVQKSQSFGSERMTFRDWPDCVHASFMMLKPRVIVEKFGRKALMDGFAFEPYHGLSKRAKGKILFLESEMHPTIPMLTRYHLEGETYAWHSWYSSRVAGMKRTEMLNYLKVGWIEDSVKQSYEFLSNLSNQQLQSCRA